jgi:hypothetical protein
MLPTVPLVSLLFALAAAGSPDAGRATSIDLVAQKVAAQIAALKLEQPYALDLSGNVQPLAVAVAERLNPLLQPIDRRSGDVRTLLSLRVDLDGQNLVVGGDAQPIWTNFWSGKSARTPPAVPLPPVRVEADALALAIASGKPVQVTPPPRAPLALKVTVLAQLSQVPAAIACRDTDGDNRAELAVLTPDAVLLLANDGKTLARFDFRTAPLAKVVAREPFGAVSLTAKPTRVAFFTARHESGQTLELDRGALRSTATTEPSVLLDGLQVRQSPGLNVFGTTVRLPALVQSVGSSKGVRLFQLVNGGLYFARGEVDPSPSGLVSGTAAALADLDGDGTPEILTSAREAFPRLELLSVFALKDAEAGAADSSASLWRGALPRGRALVAAGCDLNGDGKEEAVVGAWLEDGTGELSVVGLQ